MTTIEAVLEQLQWQAQRAESNFRATEACRGHGDLYELGRSTAFRLAVLLVEEIERDALALPPHIEQNQQQDAEFREELRTDVSRLLREFDPTKRVS